MLYNLKILKYQGVTHVEFFTCPIKRTVNEDNYNITEVINDNVKTPDIPLINDLKKDINKEHTLQVSLNRSKNNLYRIARSNKWDYFITITFNRKITDATDYDKVSKKITHWLNNIRKRKCPELKYVIVPEFHKDGKNYHFHGLLAGCDALHFKDSGRKDYLGKPIYNITDWKIGFSTATKIESNEKVTNYIGKYISKDLLNRLKNKKRYFASKNVDITEEKLYYINADRLYTDFIDMDKVIYIKTIDIDGINQIKYFEIKD